MSFIKQKRGSKWNELSKRSTNQENELTPRDDLGLKSKAWSHLKPREKFPIQIRKRIQSQRGMIPIKIGWIVSNCGRSSGHTRNGLSGMVDGARMHSRLKTRHKWDALRPSFPLLLIGASIRNFPLKGSTIRAAISSDIHFQES